MKKIDILSAVIIYPTAFILLLAVIISCTVTVIENIVGWYDIIGWKNCKCQHLSFRIWPMTTEKATFDKIDKCVNAILDTMKMHND